MLSQTITDDEDVNYNGNEVLDLSVKKGLSVLLSPLSSTPSISSSVSPSNYTISTSKRVLDSSTSVPLPATKVQQTNRRPLRFQCRHCDYKAPSTSLMQNHIYRHTDLTPYSCPYCGHRSTTKSTIMVHIELCHPNMEVKILENRVREQDFYRDLNNSEITTVSNVIHEPQFKKQRHSNQYDDELTPINGVAISLKTIIDDRNELSPASEEICEAENLESILVPASDIPVGDNEQPVESTISESSPLLKLKFPPPTPITESLPGMIMKESNSDDDSEYLLVYNRPKQYYGSLYEPDKQYACRLCTYTTNHRPSMEDHVFVHTNEKPYKCGYCGEEIYTRYAATYHIKYKHAGMPRNFIQNKADITQYYVNRAKKEEEKNQFKVIDTRRVKVPLRNGKSANNQQNKLDVSSEQLIQHESSSSSPSSRLPNVQSSTSQANTNSSDNLPTPATPDYWFLLAWSYYLAAQATWLSPLNRQQEGRSSFSFPNNLEAIAKFLQTMQTTLQPSTTVQSLNCASMRQSENELDQEANAISTFVKETSNES